MKVKRTNVAILMVEQNAKQALSISDRGYVLVTGENRHSGTGKELIAKAIHGVSKRNRREMITVNCGAIPEGIIESELFGHKKGAYTGAGGDRKGYFESAHKGTIFLDEIGEMPLDTQVKVLRALEGGD